MKSIGGTLVASTVRTETLGGDLADGVARDQVVEVLNRDGTAEIWFTVNGVTPTVGGADCYCAPAAIGTNVVDDVGIDGPVAIKLISAGTPKYQVTVFP